MHSPRRRRRKDQPPRVEPLEGRALLDSGLGAISGGPAVLELRSDRPATVPGDDDGDGASDLTLYRHDPATGRGIFEIRRSSPGSPIERTVSIPGVGPDAIPVSGDFDGDRLADLAVFDPTFDLDGDGTADLSRWSILRSSDSRLIRVDFGAAGVLDRPAPADFDGDGTTDIATFRASSDVVPGSAQWFILPSGPNRGFETSDGAFSVVFGAPGGADLPAVADYDGDGRADIAVFRPIATPSDVSHDPRLRDASQWLILPSSPNDATFSDRIGAVPIVFGAAGNADQPAPADLDGDGRADIVAFRSESDLPDAQGRADWFILPSEGQWPRFGGGLRRTFGPAGSIAASGDFDGDGRSDLAVFDPGTDPEAPGLWEIRSGLDGPSDSIAFGPGGGAAVPVSSPLFFRLRRPIAPIELTARLDPASDPNDNLIVLRPEAVVVGRTSPGATVKLALGPAGTPAGQATADASGLYRLPVSLALGTNRFRISATAPGGGQAEVDLAIDRNDVVLDWNEVLLDAIRADRTAPPRAARAMAIVHISVADAVAAITRGHPAIAVPATPPPGASPEAAAASAAHRAMIGLFPGRAAALDAELARTLAEIPDGQARDRGVSLGRSVADRVLELRRDDGSAVETSYGTPGTPGFWRPTPDAYADPLLPQWPFVRPFALDQPAQFRPGPPPALSTGRYASDLNEVRSLGGVDSRERTEEQTLIARFWADGAGTATPPGHWNQIAQDVARQRGTTLEQNARLFALLNIGLADAGISSWDAKYFYGFWRPVTAIREANSDGNPATISDPGWRPLLSTPPFPTYTSGHSTFSGAASVILAAVFGPDTAFTTTSDDFPGVVRSFSSFSQAAEEAGRSRIYGGIHFEFDNQAGLAAGREVGRHVLRTLRT